MPGWPPGPPLSVQEPRQGLAQAFSPKGLWVGLLGALGAVGVREDWGHALGKMGLFQP